MWHIVNITFFTYVLFLIVLVLSQQDTGVLLRYRKKSGPKII